jgi:hypothetical protein
MLVKLSNPPFTVLSVDSNHNIKLSDSNGNEFTVRNSLYTDFLDPMIDQKFIKLQGVLTYEYGEFKLLPRMESDIEKRPEIEDCTVNENQCNGNLINTLCDEVTLKCIEPIEIDICTEIGTECDNNTNSKTTCYNNECIELATKTILEIRTEEENLGENAIGSLYKTSGVVTAIKSNGFYLQDGVEAGIFVYTSDFTQVVGDKIDIIATAKNYNGWLELTDPIITSNGVDTLPEFTDVDALNILDLEAQESMMVNFLYPPFIVETVDGSGNVRLRDANNNKFKMRNSLYAFETPEINTVYTKLQGILTYEYAEYKLLPMSATDMIEKPEVVDCTIGGNECDVNTINTICDEMTLICIVPIEVEACNQNSDCAANTNGNIVCFNDVCVTPIEIDACTDGGDECLNNTNGKVLCVSDVCSLLPEVVDCTVGGNECDANFTNIVCNETTLKCEPLPTQPLNGDFENWVDDATPENWFGSKTSIASVNVTKSTEFQSGQFSISFLNETTDHKRFSSEATLWKAGTYSCTYFAKGTGDIRNSNTNVYGTYTNYTILVDADWTMITYDFTLDADVADFEFIFSLRNTDANGLKVDNLVCVPQ